MDERRAALDSEMDRLRALLGEPPEPDGAVGPVEAPAPEPVPAGLPLAEVLLRSGAATRSQLDLAHAHAARAGGDLVSSLLSLGVCDEIKVLGAICASRGIPFLKTLDVPAEASGWLEASVARRYFAVAIARENDEVSLVLPNPLDSHAVEELSKVLGLHVRPAAAPRAVIAAALDALYPS